MCMRMRELDIRLLDKDDDDDDDDGGEELAWERGKTRALMFS